MPRTAEMQKNHVISFRVTNEMRELLLREARRHGQTLSELVNQIFRIWIQQHAPAAAKKLSRKFAHKEHQNQSAQSLNRDNILYTNEENCRTAP